MNEKQQYLNLLKAHIKELKNNYPIKKLGLFGSVMRKDFSQNSDIDILVELDKPIGLDFVLLGNELEKLLNKKVDLISKNAIKPRYFDYIKKDLIYVE